MGIRGSSSPCVITIESSHKRPCEVANRQVIAKFIFFNKVDLNIRGKRNKLKKEMWLLYKLQGNKKAGIFSEEAFCKKKKKNVIKRVKVSGCPVETECEPQM